MNNKIVKNYAFNAVAKTVTSTDFSSIEIILSILNVTTGDIIYFEWISFYLCTVLY